jgi:hypothetical protein
VVAPLCVRLCHHSTLFERAAEQVDLVVYAVAKSVIAVAIPTVQITMEIMMVMKVSMILPFPLDSFNDHSNAPA